MNNENDKSEYLLEDGEKSRTELPVRIDIDIECDEIPARPSQRLPFIVACAITLCFAMICATWIIFAKDEIEQTMELPSEERTEEEWRGAFLESSIYESCLESSAVVRVERGSGGQFWSGFVFDEDGWIATSLEEMDKTQKGRIYVILGNGEQYVVESILSDNESSLALLKINAEGLRKVSFAQRAAQNGESVLALVAGYDSCCYVRSGEVALAKTDELRLNASADVACAGSPIFDEYGNLVGAVTGEKSEDSGIIKAISAQKLKTLLLRMRGNQN